MKRRSRRVLKLSRHVRPETVPCEASEDGRHLVAHGKCEYCEIEMELEERDEAYERAASRYDGEGKDWR
jgi:hypothetical protein